MKKRFSIKKLENGKAIDFVTVYFMPDRTFCIERNQEGVDITEINELISRKLKLESISVDRPNNGEEESTAERAVQKGDPQFIHAIVESLSADGYQGKSLD